ncbi:MAG: hypothetical protein R6T85_11250 [Egibacteraceae bacterium]
MASAGHAEGSGLLAIDLGLRTGIARFGPDGRLVAYRSQHFGSAAALRRGALRVLREWGLPALLVLEGGSYAEAWQRAAGRVDVAVRITTAEVWREGLLTPTERRDAVRAKAAAGRHARQVIAAGGLSRPHSLRHDAAEAICLGAWAVREGLA